MMMFTIKVLRDACHSCGWKKVTRHMDVQAVVGPRTAEIATPYLHGTAELTITFTGEQQ
jgi:hypothetical protein